MTGVPAPRAASPGSDSVTITPAAYLDFLHKEYLASYVGRGGAAVKLLVGGEPAARELSEGLATLGDGFLHAAVDAATTKVHMIDQLFFAVARQLDWIGLAADAVRAAYEQVGCPAPAEPGDAGRAGATGLAVAAVAAHHEMDAPELYRTVRRSLEAAVLHDHSLSHEFRMAMFRLCQAHLGRGDVNDAERTAVLGWLRGDKVPAAELRAVSLKARVARHNARPLLVSTARWLRRVGRAGLVLQLDLERLAVSRRPPAGLRDGIYYSKATALDAYELLRQLIDSTDELEGMFVAVLLPPELVADESRGLPAYTALHLRVADEVRDRRRANPYAVLVRINPAGSGIGAAGTEPVR